MSCAPTVAGRALQHVESFSAGTARLQLVVPANAGGRLMKVKVTVTTGERSATRVATFRVLRAGQPSLSVTDTWVGEGNAGTATLVFDVTLSNASPAAVTVSYATSDGSATQPGDYAAASGQLRFAPGETAQAIEVAVVGDGAVEQDETLTVTLSDPLNASIARGTATGTITNDDTGQAVTPGEYKGATQEGNYVYFTVLADRKIKGFRVNALPCRCRPGGGWLRGGEDVGETLITIRPNATFAVEVTWTGSERTDDVEWTSRYVKVVGSFPTATSAKGTIAARYEFNEGGVHYVCNSWTKTWTAALQG
ncbi:MAG: Calx-beta domain-containing protein [Gaiella sp.]